MRQKIGKKSEYKRRSHEKDHGRAGYLRCYGLGAIKSYAGVNWNINIGVPVVAGTPPPPPHPVVVDAPPEMMYMPEAGVYVAVGTPYELFLSAEDTTIFVMATGTHLAVAMPVASLVIS